MSGCQTKSNPAPSATMAPRNIQVEIERFGREAVGTTVRGQQTGRIGKTKDGACSCALSGENRLFLPMSAAHSGAWQHDGLSLRPASSATTDEGDPESMALADTAHPQLPTA